MVLNIIELNVNLEFFINLIKPYFSMYNYISCPCYIPRFINFCLGGVALTRWILKFCDFSLKNLSFTQKYPIDHNHILVCTTTYHVLTTYQVSLNSVVWFRSSADKFVTDIRTDKPKTISLHTDGQAKNNMSPHQSGGRHNDKWALFNITEWFVQAVSKENAVI